jgi:hypothetical protein
MHFALAYWLRRPTIRVPRRAPPRGSSDLLAMTCARRAPTTSTWNVDGGSPTCGVGLISSWSPIGPTTIRRWTKARGRLVASSGNCACGDLWRRIPLCRVARDSNPVGGVDRQAGSAVCGRLRPSRSSGHRLLSDLAPSGLAAEPSKGLVGFPSRSGEEVR